ncbi:cytochrome c oxidase subunit II [Nocardioidaceae bacterium SCSIO 66511]|nr:cytochrome c oxidase subunit II [Nocardioidaceae bacterium SCSIO 66511]
MGPELPQNDAVRAAGRRRPSRTTRVLRSAALLPLAVFLASCSKDSDNEWLRMALPKSASTDGEQLFGLWLGAWIAVGVTFLLVFGLIVWSMVRYRLRSENYVPVQMRYHLPIEMLYTVAPVIAVAAFFFHTVEVQNDINEESENPDHVITVVGQKWAWTFDYMGEDAVNGKDVFDDGSPDDIADLYLPVGESVRFELRSPDVIHSFWIPEFYRKLDVVPGEENSFQVTPDTEGTFTGRCAELCGMYHSRMLFNVHIVSPEEYDEHLRDLEAEGNVGAPMGGADGSTVKGLEEAEEEAS